MIIATAGFVVLGVFIAAVVLYVARMRAHDILATEKEFPKLEAVHIPAVLNLIDPVQENFLRTRLPRSEFLAIKRLRNKALIVYVKRILNNCGTLIAYADRAMRSNNPNVVAAGHDLLNAAFQTRLNALVSLAGLYVTVLMPQLPSNMTITLKKYSRNQDQVAAIRGSMAPS